MSREEVLRLHCPVSAEARSSMSPTRQDMREHSRSILAMNFLLVRSCPCSAYAGADDGREPAAHGMPPL